MGICWKKTFQTLIYSNLILKHMAKKQTTKKEIDRKYNKETKQQKLNLFPLLKLPLIILALIFLIKVANQYLHWYTIKYFEPTGIISLGIFFYAGWILRKNNFTFLKKIQASLILFIPSFIFSLIFFSNFLPAIPLLYRLLNLILLIVINYVLFTLLLLLGSGIAGKMKK